MIEKLTKIQVRLAACASYVSRTCREHYPSRNPGREFIFSSVRLNKQLMTGPRKAEQFDAIGLRIISVGRLEREKGHHVLVEAIAKLPQKQRATLRVQIVGGGRQLEVLRERVKSLELEGIIELPGTVKYGEPLFELLDAADLFVLPSMTEGMPRALIEGMARGLPAIGCRAGGIVEVLEDKQMVPPSDAESLANAIADRLGQRDRLALESRRNFEFVTQNYGIETMRQRKIAFWNAVLKHTNPLTQQAIT